MLPVLKRFFDESLEWVYCLSLGVTSVLSILSVMFVVSVVSVMSVSNGEESPHQTDTYEKQAADINVEKLALPA